MLNSFVAKHRIQSVTEFGCSDGEQLQLAHYPRYVGFDVSTTAIAKCRALFAHDATKWFDLVQKYRGDKTDVAISLDVIFHLVEDDIFEQYMFTLFDVVIYSSNRDENRGYDGAHVRHRRFTTWVEQNMPAWKLLQHIPNRYPYKGDYREGSFADFFIYGTESASSANR